MPESPEAYPRRILLAVTGLSPQIVTETLYALAVKRGAQAWIPTEIQVLTTTQGAENARLNLLSDDPGWFHRLCRDYRLPGIAFGPGDVHVMRRKNGEPLEDILDDADNIAAADFITEHVRFLTGDESTSLHVSIAGGRKTMGFFLGYALSLFGRPQDRLSHVLVSTPFESHNDFYYPSPETRVLHADRQTRDAKNGKVWLGDIPFVRLRDGLPEELLSGASRFSDSVAAAQRAFAPLSLIVELSREGAVIRAGGTNVEMAPADAAFYLLIARAAAEGHTRRWNDANIGQDYLREYQRFVPRTSARFLETEARLKDPILDGWFEERKAKCNAALRRALGKASARAYGIHGFGVRGATRYGLALRGGLIRIIVASSSATASLRSASVRAACDSICDPTQPRIEST